MDKKEELKEKIEAGLEALEELYRLAFYSRHEHPIGAEEQAHNGYLAMIKAAANQSKIVLEKWYRIAHLPPRKL